MIKANKVDDAYLTSDSVKSYSDNNHQAVNNTAPKAYKCPNCEGQVAYGEANCKNCGTAFKWD